MPSTSTKVRNAIDDKAKGSFLPGFGELRKAVVYSDKCDSLKRVLQAYFQDTRAYDGFSFIDENDSLMAIKYAISKLSRKSVREGTKGLWIFSAGVGGAIAGATVGTVIPCAGTVAGGTIGFVSLEALASVGVGVADYTARGLKCAYKNWVQHNRGEHRMQAARALDHCARTRYQDAYGEAAVEALQIILGAKEFQRVMAKDSPEAIKEIAECIKSV